MREQRLVARWRCPSCRLGRTIEAESAPLCPVHVRRMDRVADERREETRSSTSLHSLKWNQDDTASPSGTAEVRRRSEPTDLERPSGASSASAAVGGPAPGLASPGPVRSLARSRSAVALAVGLPFVSFMSALITLIFLSPSAQLYPPQVLIIFLAFVATLAFPLIAVIPNTLEFVVEGVGLAGAFRREIHLRRMAVLDKRVDSARRGAFESARRGLLMKGTSPLIIEDLESLVHASPTLDHHRSEEEQLEVEFLLANWPRYAAPSTIHSLTHALRRRSDYPRTSLSVKPSRLGNILASGLEGLGASALGDSSGITALPEALVLASKRSRADTTIFTRLERIALPSRCLGYWYS